jgi:D-lyxose ketol-isomerase
MKRSEINRHIAFAKEFFAKHLFFLPDFAFWTPAQWQSIGTEADEIRSRRLGWDMTDFNLGTFEKKGLTLFTIRNGKLDDPDNRKTYAEKIMLAYEGQVTPWHYHKNKTEDIINRGAGVLVIELYESDINGKFSNKPVYVSCDGLIVEVPPGGSIELKPGESITLPPLLFHTFYGRKGAGPCLIGEVSSVNDDATDNFFAEPLPRYPKVEEDEKPLHLLCNEYPAVR